MKRALLGAALAAAFVPPVGAATYTIGRWAGFDAIGARSIAVGDLNWDTLQDLAVTTHDEASGLDEVKIFLQQPDGTLQETSDDLWFASLSPSITMADIDYDSEKEILVGSASGFERIHYKLADDFSPPSFYPRHVDAPSGCDRVVAGDLDGDHAADVVCQSLDAGATVFHNDGSGGFPETADLDTVTVPATTLSLGDLSGDGKLDLLVSSPNMFGFAVHPHSGGWTFGAATDYPRPSLATVGANAVGDMDHDGRLEALIASRDYDASALIWDYPRGTGGLLGAPVSRGTQDVPVALVVSDLNRDGRDDLVVGSAAGRGIGVDLQGDEGYTSLGGDAVFAGDSNSIATGDLDDDGCTDIAYVTDTGGVAIGHGSNCVRARHVADFDGDGKSDLLWHNSRTGANTVWMAADSARKQVLTGAGAAWHLAGSGDFNHDGKSDLLWHNDTTGAGVIWYSGNYATRLTMPVVDKAWHIAGIGDFDGDRFDDVLWRNATDGRNAIWRSAKKGSQLPVTGVTNLDWRVVGVADFNGDGHADILWRNPLNGGNIIWKSAKSTTRMSVASNTDRNAKVWVADYNGDRRADLLWVYSNGDIRIWLKPDATLGQNQDPNAMPSADWRIVATADYDGNGTSDLAWRNMRTGANMIWRSAAAGLSRPIKDVTDFNWVVLPQQ